MGSLLVFLSSVFVFCLFLLLEIVKFIKSVWWNPIQIQSNLRSQGIKGPYYKILHGSTKEIMKMKKEVISSDLPLSHEVFTRVHPHIYTWIKLYGDNFLMFSPKAELVVTEPDLIKVVLANKDGAYPKRKLDEYMKKLLGDGIVTTRGQKWSKLRKIANHAFHAESLKGMIPAMIQSTETMLKRWTQHEDKEIEVYQEFRLLTSEVISRTAFGSSYLEGEHIFRMLMRLVVLIARNRSKVKIPVIGTFMRTSDDVESNEIERQIRNSMLKIINKREEAAILGQLESYGSDYLGMLVKSNHEQDTGNKLSLDDMIDECKTFYTAGHETTTNSLTWTVFLLAIHTNWQDKAREEVLQLFGQKNPTADGISRLKIVSMIINESLRLYPPILFIIRQVGRKIRLGKLSLPQNIVVSIPTLALHHDPRVWGEDAHMFKPERFADGVAKATNNNLAAFIPFGMGPRNCVGSNFALTETKVALSMILQKYRFTLSPTYRHSPTDHLTLIPEHGVQVILQAI